jgi:eukaryotic-like serine/threonine-protein kinase
VSDDQDPGLDPDFSDVTEVSPVTVGPPETIGNYRIQQKLGEGGMGVVYEAQQLHPVRRIVALKVIKLGMDTAQVVVRFESERHALALMNHPNIARVYDAGATAEGRPFFAMECVKGVPITDYCRRHKLDLRARLELFMQVCSGVEHAHQKGVIHRDLKPSNVLVREQDGAHVPKIIDFGIAKATAHRLTDKTLYTEMGQLIGTPEYMSPEQAEMSGVDIDTRTDVYLLGVMLYELLCGELPFPASELAQVGFQEYRRRVIEVEPPKPSARIAAASDAGRAHATALGLEPRALARALHGDLDWIAMKALAKEPPRRYASASELSGDLRRHLEHEPVLAGPPSNVYRMRKFARRHKAGVAFALVLLVLLTGFATVMAVQANRLSRANSRVKLEADRATREAATLRQVSDFLEGVFKISDPAEARGRDITAREVLDQAASQIATELKDTPEVQARLMSIIGDVYTSHRLKDQARTLLEQALKIQRDLGHDDDLELAVTMKRLAGLLSVDFGDIA